MRTFSDAVSLGSHVSRISNSYFMSKNRSQSLFKLFRSMDIRLNNTFKSNVIGSLIKTITWF